MDKSERMTHFCRKLANLQASWLPQFVQHARLASTKRRLFNNLVHLLSCALTYLLTYFPTYLPTY